jgi:secretion/DNA translocation related CpaE-like protein
MSVSLASSVAVLLVTADEHLAQRVLRLAAAAGAAVEVLADVAAVAPRWREPAVLLVGADAAARVAAIRPDRRDACWLVTASPAGSATFRDALTLGASGVLELPAADQYVVDLLADLEEQPERAWVVGVVGGAGGAGATTLAAALAQTAARSAPALLVDADELGPGADRMVGLDGADGLHWEDLPVSGGRLGAVALREGVPRRAQLGVLTWGSARVRDPLAAETARSAVDAARRGHAVVVLDLARHGGPLAAELAGRCDVVHLITPSTVPGVAAAVRVASCLRLSADRTSLVLRPGGLLEEDVSVAVGLPVACRLADQKGVRALVDAGLGPAGGGRGPLGRATRLLLEQAA